MIAGGCSDNKLKADLIYFQRLFPDNCLFKINHIPANEVSNLMKVADIGLLPYNEITTSAAAMLFMSYGLPLIASDLPAMKEILEKTPCQFFSNNNAISLEDAISKAIPKLTKLTDMDRLKIKEHTKLFDWSTISYATVSTYYKLIQKNPRSDC